MPAALTTQACVALARVAERGSGEEMDTANPQEWSTVYSLARVVGAGLLRPRDVGAPDFGPLCEAACKGFLAAAERHTPAATEQQCSNLLLGVGKLLRASSCSKAPASQLWRCCAAWPLGLGSAWPVPRGRAGPMCCWARHTLGQLCTSRTAGRWCR